MSKTIIDFSKLSDTELDQQAEKTFNKMNGNELFAEPRPELSVLEANLADYRNSLVTSALNDRHQVVLKNQKRATLEWTLRCLGQYVDGVAEKDPAIILAAGFEPAKGNTPVGPCPKATGLRVKPGEIGSGVANVAVKRDHTAHMYRFEYRLAGNVEWVWLQARRSRIQLQGLEGYKAYEFRAAYIGTDPSITYSDVVSAVVL